MNKYTFTLELIGLIESLFCGTQIMRCWREACFPCHDPARFFRFYISLLIDCGSSSAHIFFLFQLQLKYAYELLDEFCRLPDNIKQPYLRSGVNNQGYVKPSKYLSEPRAILAITIKKLPEFREKKVSRKLVFL